APTAIALSADSIAENQPAGTTIGAFSTSDPDNGDTFTYSLVGGIGSGDNESLTISGNVLQTAAPFDFEVQNSYSIRVRATDAGGLAFEKVFTISVTNVDEAPVFTSSAVLQSPENQHAVGFVDAVDPEDGDAAGYSLVGGADRSL